MSQVMVTVIADGRRLDLALPAEVTVERLLPEIAELFHIHPALLWTLAPMGGGPLAHDRSLAQAGVPTGAILYLLERGGPRRPAPVRPPGERAAAPPSASLRPGASPTPAPARPHPAAPPHAFAYGRPRRAPVADLLVVGGPAAGLRVPLTEGEHRVGGHRYSSVMLGDSSLSRIHLAAVVGPTGQVRVGDAGSSRGTFLDGCRLVGPVDVRPDQVVAPGCSLLAFVPPGALPPAPPAQAVEPGRRFPLGRPPAPGWGNRGAAREFRDRLAQLDGELAEIRAAAAARLRASTPDAVRVLELGRSGAPPPRRRGGRDWLALRVGWGSVSSGITVELPRGGDPTLVAEARQLLGRHQALDAVPVTVSLASAGGLGLAGQSGPLAALCRWLVIQLAVLHVADDLCLIAAADDPAALGWLERLPHARNRPPALPFARVPGGVRTGELLEGLGKLLDDRRGGGGAGRAPVVVALVDLRGDPTPALLARLFREGPDVGIHVVCLRDDLARIPADCGAVVEAPAGRAPTLLLRRQGGRYELGGLDGISERQALDAAGALRPRLSVPARMGLAEALSLPPDIERHVLESWIRDRSRTGSRPLQATCGVDLDGNPVSLDLRAAGHLLVGGASGSGKSELLRLLAAGLAVRHSPRTLRLAVGDLDGALEPCAQLPHVVSRASGLERARELIAWLARERAWRVEVLRGTAARGLDELERARPGMAFARLVVLLDGVLEDRGVRPADLAALVGDGSRLGVHLVLAGAPAGRLARTGLDGARLALRCADGTESSELIGTGDAGRAGLQPGQGFLTAGAGPVVEFQAPSASGATLDRVVQAVARVHERLGLSG
jgi:DNA segregation ATPase FtsK/SpoIIIE, S-DNA-T family